jgi:SAM-dependent methyltransferase
MSAHTDLQSVACNLCDSNSHTRIMHKHGYIIVKCNGCGLVFVNPRMRAEDLAEQVYGEEYFGAERGYGLEDHFSDRSRALAMRWGRERLDWIEQSAKPGRVLDVGCAAGFFLLAAKERGWDPHGMEISDHAASYARETLGLDVATGEFSSVDPEPDSFDLITMLDVIEHFADPLQALRNAHAALRPGGRLFAVTPNFDSLAAKTLGDKWGLVEPEHHLFYFTPQTLDAILEKAGFRVAARRWPLLGLNDLLLSAGALQKAGVPMTADRKKNLRRLVRGPRNAARTLMGAADSRVLAPLFARGRGVIIEVLAEKA